MEISFKAPVTFSWVGGIYPLRHGADSFNSPVTFLRWIVVFLGKDVSPSFTGGSANFLAQGSDPSACCRSTCCVSCMIW